MKKLNLFFILPFVFSFLHFGMYQNSFSQVSQELIKKLNEKVEVKMIFSDNIPNPYNSLKTDVIKILNEYEKLADGKIIVEKNEGKSDDYFEVESEKYGIQPVQIQTIDDDKLAVRKAFMGLAFSYPGKKNIIPVISSTDNLEYNINKILYYFTLDKKKKIGFLKGHGEYDYTKWTNIINMLSDNYDLVSVDISNFNPVPQDIDVLMIIAPKKSLPETHKFIIDQFIMRGGNVAWLINKIVPDFQQQIIVGDILNIDLDDLLANYGIVINPDLIKDIQCSQVQIQSQDGIPIALNYPYFPNITNIDKENPVFNSIQSVVLQFVSSINIDAAQNKGITAKPLLITSDKSGKTEGFFILNLEQFQNLTKRASDTLFSHNGFVVGATCTGKFTSFYAGKMIPMDTSRNSSSYTKETLDASLKESKMVVIGDGDFANEESKPPKDNLNFFCNLIEYLAIDINLYEQKK